MQLYLRVQQLIQQTLILNVVMIFDYRSLNFITIDGYPNFFLGWIYILQCNLNIILAAK